MNYSIYLKLLVCFLFTQVSFAQFTIPETPKAQTSVYDYANVLNSTEKKQLEQKLIKYSDSTTTQIVVVTIESLKGEDIGILTPKWLHQWGLGQAKKDNGVLILLAKTERKIWISAGYGLEDRLTAGIGGEITRNIIIPEFKAGSYYKGLDKGTDALFDVFKGKYKGTRKKNNDGGGGIPIIFFIGLFVFILIIISKNKNNGGNSGNRGGGLDLSDIIILSSLGRGGFGGGSSSGGGFGGGDFGGGGFGGGFGGGGSSGGGSGGSW